MLASTYETSRSAAALHRVLIKARHLALQDPGHCQLAAILDWAELLAADMAAPDNRAPQFAEHLHGLGDDHLEFAGVFRDYRDDRCQSDY